MSDDLKLAQYYDHELKNFTIAEKYYINATTQKNTIAMFSLAIHYHITSQDYCKAKMYYRMCIKNKFYKAAHYLANYYRFIEKDYKEALKYYLLCANHIPEYNKYELATLYIDMERYNEAKELLNELKSHAEDTHYLKILVNNSIKLLNEKIKNQKYKSKL